MTLLLLGVGFAVFFITVYGIVMISGLKMTRQKLEEQPELREGMSDDDMKPLPTDVEY